MKVFVGTVIGAVAIGSASTYLMLFHEPAPAPTLDTPSRITLTWATNDPATSITVSWLAPPQTPDSVLQIRPASADPTAYDKPTIVPATNTGSVDVGEGVTRTFYRAMAGGLTPATRYSYRVGRDGAWSNWTDFTTLSDSPEEPLTFLYLGDAQAGHESLWARLVNEAVRQTPDARFVVHSGDLVNRASSDPQWYSMTRAADWLHSVMPVLAAPGNHEYSRGKVSPFWPLQFDFPDNGLGELRETNYFVDVQGVRLICLDSNVMKEQQAQWLKGVLADDTSRWKVVFFHHPLRSTARGRDNSSTRDAFEKVLSQGADLVLTGHDHTYGRRFDPDSGMVSVTSVSGAKMYPLGRDAMNEMDVVGENVQLYQVIRIEGDTLRFESRTALGTMFDSFTLTKESGTNVLRSGQ